MASQPAGNPAADRQKGLELVQGWTLAITVGALGLTGVLAVAAAETFAGHTIGQASPAPTSSTDLSQSTNPDDQQPQSPADNSFGSGTQPPAVVSGGS